LVHFLPSTRVDNGVYGEAHHWRIDKQNFMTLMSSSIGMIATYSLVAWKELGAITLKLDFEETTLPIALTLSHRYHIFHLVIKLGAHRALFENKIPLILCHFLTSPSSIFPCQFYFSFLMVLSNFEVFVLHGVLKGLY
jgi:hypothetical protein